MIARSAVTQEVNRLTVNLTDVALEEIELESIRIKVLRLKLSLTRLFRGEIDPKSIRSGSVSVVVTEAAIEEAAGFVPEATDFSAGTVTVQDGDLTVEAGGGMPVISIPFPENVLPCSATGSFSGGEVRLGCSVDEIPALLLRNLPS